MNYVYQVNLKNLIKDNKIKIMQFKKLSMKTKI